MNTRKKKSSRLKLFGRLRYVLSVLFGQWVLVAWNTRDYRNVDKRNLYKSETIANKYAKRLEQKYDTVEIEKVYDKYKGCIGYLVMCKGKKVSVQNQPSNVISFTEIQALRKLKSLS